MRIWDVSPGYLTRQSLLGEHREIHALFAVLSEKKKGYSRHPETLRWIGRLGGVKKRHDMLVAEMKIRGYKHHSPIDIEKAPAFPIDMVDSYEEQIKLLKKKYKAKTQGRIPLPKHAQEMWAHHKFSVMARDITIYENIGKALTDKSEIKKLEHYAQLFYEMLLSPPRNDGMVRNAVEHMWGYVSKYNESNMPSDTKELLLKIAELAFKNSVTYITNSTAISDLLYYLE